MFSLLFDEVVSKEVFSTYLEPFFFHMVRTSVSFYIKHNLTVTFLWKLHVLKLLVNYFSGTLTISMGYIIGNFTVYATKILD